MSAVFMTSEFAIISIDDELAAFLADYDAYAGVDSLIPVDAAAVDPGAAPADQLLDAADPAVDAGADDFIPLDPGAIDPDAPPADPVTTSITDPVTGDDATPVVDPMVSDDGTTFDPAAVAPAADDGSTSPADAPGLAVSAEPAADPGVDAGADLVMTFEDVDLGAELGILMVGRSFHAFDFSNLP